VPRGVRSPKRWRFLKSEDALEAFKSANLALLARSSSSNGALGGEKDKRPISAPSRCPLRPVEMTKGELRGKGFCDLVGGVKLESAMTARSCLVQ
jgi:hypothetical protein